MQILSNRISNRQLTENFFAWYNSIIHKAVIGSASLQIMFTIVYVLHELPDGNSYHWNRTMEKVRPSHLQIQIIVLRA